MDSGMASGVTEIAEVAFEAAGLLLWKAGDVRGEFVSSLSRSSLCRGRDSGSSNDPDLFSFHYCRP